MKYKHEGIYTFKVTDYTTILLGRYHKSEDPLISDGYFYIERGDGTRYKYAEYRIEWAEVILQNGL